MQKEDKLWYKDAILCEINVRTFQDSNGDGIGDLKGIEKRLDYFQYLGIDCIYFLPIYESPLIDNGYDISNYCKLQKEIGTIADLKRIISKAHKMGIKVLLDLVINHTSDKHPWFIESRSSKKNPKRKWYHWSKKPKDFTRGDIMFYEIEKSNWTYDEKTGEYYFHRYFREQPDLNYNNPEVHQALLKIMEFWLDKGIDGFRVDAAAMFADRAGTDSENLKRTHDFAKKMRQYMDKHYKNKILMAEACEPPEKERKYFGRGDEFNLVMDFLLIPRLFIALKKEQRDEIIDILNRTRDRYPATQWCMFLRNHDQLLLRRSVDHKQKEFLYREYAPNPKMRCHEGICRRLAPLVDNDQRRIELLFSIIFTLKGTPLLYYGQEIGMGDLVGLDDRDGIRTPMQWTSGKNAGFSKAAKNKLAAHLIEDGEYSYKKINVQDEYNNPDSLFVKLWYMLRVRKEYPIFGKGSIHYYEPKNKAILSYTREYGGTTIIVLHNLSSKTQETTINLSKYHGRKCIELLSNKKSTYTVHGKFKVKMKPYEYRWLKIL